jgi:hypothetical protein
LFDFLGDGSYDGEDYQHDLFGYVLRRVGWRDFVNLESLEEIFHALEDADEYILTRVNGLSHLKEAGENDQAWDSSKDFTEKRTQMPTKMTLAGDST